MRPFLGAMALALAVLLAAGAADAEPGKAKKRRAAGAGPCGEKGFQACMNKCISNILISNGSRITSKCSRRCHKRMENHC